MARPMANTKASLCNISNKNLPTHVNPLENSRKDKYIPKDLQGF